MRVSRSDGAELAAEVIGEAGHPLLLLVAGADCSMDWWRPEFCAELVALGLRVIRYDQRGTGETTLGPRGTRREGLPTALGDALAVLDAAQAIDAAAAGSGPAAGTAADARADAHWVAFSAGGWVAQLAALDHPDRVRSLTLISTRPTGPGSADPDLPAVADRLAATWAHPRPEPDWTDEAAVVDHLVDVDRDYAGDEFDEEHERAIWTATVRRSPGMHRDEGGADVFDATVRWRERLGSLRVPTTVLHGTADPLFPLGNGEALAREIPGARFAWMPGVGHELPPRAWRAVVDAVASPR
ncbi:alpha/beta hydrolase [Agromyces mariniharenae]|uniref:Alpha/beta hydrolase n=2 Tax=Agromyces mariniharenae TaxID=2604423 RepID=A0A5S4VD52_9MICO|nr:alpha/beta hydrolase [Agromyces mariniharenae]